jgi:hypothetical protein
MFFSVELKPTAVNVLSPACSRRHRLPDAWQMSSRHDRQSPWVRRGFELAAQAARHDTSNGG